MPQLPSKLLTSGLELSPLPANAAWPGILPEGIDHRAADTTFGERLELDASRLVEAVGCVNQTDDAILDEIPNIDGMGHRGCDATGKLLDER
jgi:hypothetical protein